MGRFFQLAKYAVPKFTNHRSAAYTYRWTKDKDYLLPDHYKNRALEFMTSDPTPVHWIPDERKYKWVDDKKQEVKRVQNVPIPVKFPKQANEGLWGGEGIIQGIKKPKKKNCVRQPYLWIPKISRENFYSEILDRWMSINVTRKVSDLVDEHQGFDHYILATPERDLNSLLGMRLKREMLLAIARKSMYPDDPAKRDLMYKRYKKYELPFTRSQEMMTAQTPTSFTRVTSISTSSDEEYYHQNASMYDDTSDLSKKSKNRSRSCCEILSDNHCVPECNLGSRTMYYAEFMNDHHHLSLRSVENDSAKSSDDSDNDEIPFPRIVEGCEDTAALEKNNKSHRSTSSISHKSSSTTRQRSRGLSRRKSSISSPRASSTMIGDSVRAPRNRVCKPYRSFTPKSSSTFIGNLKSQPTIPCVEKDDLSYIQYSETMDDINSVYTWSIHDDGNKEGSLEELYLQKVTGVSMKPPLPPRKNNGKTTNITKYSSGSSVTRSFEPMSGIETLSSYNSSENVTENKSNGSESRVDTAPTEVLPRTSTRACLFTPVPSKGSNDFHKVPDMNKWNRKNNGKGKTTNITKYSSGSSVTRSFEPMSGIETLSSYNSSDNVTENKSNGSERLDSAPTEVLPRTSTRACLFTPVPSKGSNDFHKVPDMNKWNRKNNGKGKTTNITKYSSGSSVTRSFEPMSGIETLSSYNSSENVTENKSNGSESKLDTAPTEVLPRTNTRACLFAPVPSKASNDFHKVPDMNKPKKGLRRSGRGIFKKQSPPSSVHGNISAALSEDLIVFQEYTTKNQDNHVKDKHTVMKKLKRFSRTLLRQDSTPRSKIQTLANL